MKSFKSVYSKVLISLALAMPTFTATAATAGDPTYKLRQQVFHQMMQLQMDPTGGWTVEPPVNGFTKSFTKIDISTFGNREFEYRILAFADDSIIDMDGVVYQEDGTQITADIRPNKNVSMKINPPSVSQELNIRVRINEVKSRKIGYYAVLLAYRNKKKVLKSYFGDD